MRIDCHVHVSACIEPDGIMSPRLLSSVPFRFMRWRFGIEGNDQAAQDAVVRLMRQTIDQTTELDAAVILAFDAVHTPDGKADWNNTHLYVSNDFVMQLTANQPRMLFGASVHPFRKDAVAEIERCIKAGAVLLKWLPIVQDFDPSDERCIPVYEVLAHYDLPLLSHTGGERALPNLRKHVESPMLLEPALKRGVKVIAAHCGTHCVPWEANHVDAFARLAREYEHCYGDTAALNLPFRRGAYDLFAKDSLVASKILHGSDWPIIALPSMRQAGLRGWRRLMKEPNWLRRDVLIKQQLGVFDDDYWTRASKVLRIPERHA